jgi:hypothetical protein
MTPERLIGVLMKIETTSGVDAAPGATDAVRPVGIPTFTPGYLEPGLRDDVVTGVLGSIGRTDPAGRMGTVAITLEARGRGAAYGAAALPEADAALIACGMTRVVTATGGAEKVEYFSVDSGNQTVTIWAYTANKLIKLVGCVATAVLSAEALRRGLMQFTFTGRMAVDPAEISAASATFTFNGTNPPLFHSATASIGSWTSVTAGDPLVLKSASIDVGNTSAERPSAGATDGLIGYTIVDRKMRQTLVYEVPAIASHDAFALSKAVGTNQPFTAWQLGTQQYNRIKFATGRWAMEMPSLGGQNDIAVQTVAGNLVQGTEPIRARELLITYD